MKKVKIKFGGIKGIKKVKIKAKRRTGHKEEPEDEYRMEFN